MTERNIIKKSPPALPLDTRERKVRQHPEISVEKALNMIVNKCSGVNFKKYGCDRNCVIILPEAWEELKTMIYWGKRTPINAYEQIYQGMGHFFKGSDDAWILIVSHFLYIYAAQRSATSACISNGVYDSMMKRLEYEREIYNKNEVRCNNSPEGTCYDPFVEEFGISEVNLYGHTHPDLGVFFSPDDRTSGYATPDLPAAIFVADPIRMQLKAAVGIEQEAATIIVCEYEADKKKAGKNKLAEIKRKEQESHNVMEEKNYQHENYKTADELIVEISKNCNRLLNPIYGAKGTFSSYTTSAGKEHIKVDIVLNPKVGAKRRAKNRNPDIIDEWTSAYDTYA